MSNTNVKNKGKYILYIIAIILGICMMSGCGKEEISFANTPYGAVDCVGKDKDTVRDDFLSVGFVNISEEVIEDLELTEKDKYGEVESVSINGVIDFEGNTEFKNTSKVVIKYHSYKTIGMPFSSEEAKTMDADAILKTFEDAGFTEITIDEIYDLDPDVVTSEIENHITIDGESFFEKDERFPINAEVEIVTHRKYEKYTVKIIIDFVSNLIFSRYDVEFEIDDNTEILKHGKDAEFEYRLKQGKYEITFESAESSSVKETVEIDITGDTEVSYKISCHSDKISVTTNYVENKGDIGENEAMVPSAASSCKYKNYKDIEMAFKNAGFTNIKTEILYDIVWGWTDEGEVEKVSIDGKKDFKRGDIFSKDAAIVITYHMKEDDDPNKKEETTPSAPTPETPDSVFYSTNDYETAKKGNSGVFSYKNKSGSYDVYWIIDFDEGYAYFFTDNNGEDFCDKIKISSGTLNDRVTVTWNIDGEKTNWYLHFKYVNSPVTLIINDHLGITTEFTTTDLDDALSIRDTKKIKMY